MILAAGFGTRLNELTRDLPKPLIRIRGHYLIEYALYSLKRAGIKDVIINTHYHASKISDAIRDGKLYGLNVSYSHEEVILGTGGGLKNAEHFFDDQPFVLINSDIICDIELKHVIEDHRNKNADATMVVRKDPTLPNYNEIILNADQRIVAVNRRPALSDEKTLTERMFTGIHVLSPIVFTYLRPEFSSIISEFYQKGIADGLNINGFDFRGFWMDAGTKENIQLAEQDPLIPIINF